MASQDFQAFRQKVQAQTGGGFSDEPTPPGTHLATIAVAMVRDTKAGDPRLRAKFVVDSGPHCGTSVWYGTNVDPSNEKGTGYLLKDADTLGVDWDAADEQGLDFMDGKLLGEYIAAQLAGKRAEIKVREGKGNFGPDVQYINRVPKGAPEPQAPAPKSATPTPSVTPTVPTVPTVPSVPNPIRDAL